MIPSTRRFRASPSLAPAARWWRFAGLLAAVLLPFGSATQASVPAEEQRAYFDELLTSMMQRNEIPGLAAVLVQGDQTLFTAGYGWANVAQQVRVVPERTVFLLGSVSKVVTSIGVLQLAESGAVDLDADISRYLDDLRIDNRFPSPVTLRQLLTHTDGFDVRWLFNGAARVPGKVQPLAKFLEKLPPRLFPPGEIYLYSDVGLTLAGYIIERVSQQPFADYMERHVFSPLAMHTATFRAERKSYARDRATGYDYDRSGRLRPVPIVYPRATPASGLTATIPDMAPLMIALLQSGRWGDTQLLSAKATREMEQRQFSHHPALPGTAFGYYEYFHRGRRALVHGGLLPGFTSVLILLPDVGVGLCVVANRFDLIGPFENELLKAVMDRFPPPDAGSAAPPSPPVAFAGPRTPADTLTGAYRCDQYSRYSLDKILVLGGLASELRVEAEPDGSLRFEPDRGRWTEISPRLFQEQETGERVVFHLDEKGRGSRILGSAQFMSYHRIGFMDDIRNSLGLFGALVLVTLLGAIRAIRAKRRARLEHTPSVMLQWLRWGAILLAVGVVGFGLGLANAMAKLNFVSAAFGESPLLAMVRQSPIVFGCLALGQLLLAGFELLVSGLSSKEPLIYATAAAAALLLFPLLSYWNLLKLPFLA